MGNKQLNKLTNNFIYNIKLYPNRPWTGNSYYSLTYRSFTNCNNLTIRIFFLWDINQMQLFYCLNYDILHTDRPRRHQEGNTQERGCIVVPDSNAFAKHSYSPVNKATGTAFISMYKKVFLTKEKNCGWLLILEFHPQTNPFVWNNGQVAV